MTESFNELEEKKTNTFALFVGVTLATVIFGLFSFIVILASSDKIKDFMDTGSGSKSKTEFQTAHNIYFQLQKFQ